MSYIRYGPFNAGLAPGINKTFLDGVEDFLTSINPAATDADVTSSAGIMQFLSWQNNPAKISATGQTAGFADLYQPLKGVIKIVILYFNGYRNATTTEQTLALPQGFSTGALWWSGAAKKCRPYSGATALSNKVNVITSLSDGANAGGSALSNTTQGLANGEIISGFDHIGLGVSQGQNSSAFVIFIGI